MNKFRGFITAFYSLSLLRPGPTVTLEKREAKQTRNASSVPRPLILMSGRKGHFNDGRSWSAIRLPMGKYFRDASGRCFD